VVELSDAARASVEALLARDDVVLSRAVLEDYVRQGFWSERSVVDLLEEHRRTRPDALALADEAGQRWTFRQLDQCSDAIASWFIGRGYRPGDFVGLLLPNWSEFFLTMLGAIKARVLPVNLHLTYRAHELADVLGRTRARALLTPTSFRGVDYESLAHSVSERLPDLEHVIVCRGVPRRAASIRFEALVSFGAQGPSPAELGDRRPNGFDPLLTLVSSGTTGHPKLVLHIHNSFLHPGRPYREILGLRAEDRWAAITPVGHSTAVSQMFWGVLCQGSSLALLTTWDAGRALDLFERERITHTIGATPLYADLLRQDGLRNRGLELRLLVYGGAPMPSPLVTELHDTFGCAVVPFYGYSEGTGHTTCAPGTAVEVVATTIGVVLPGSSARLVGPDGEPVPPGTPGEFWAKGPNIAVGYYGEPERTRALMTPDGYFKSGDVLVELEGGVYRYVARNDDIINRGGQKIDPKEVEDILFRHPKVREAVLVGAHDPRLVEVAVAFVVPAAGESPTLDELREYLAEEGVARWKWPERLVLKDAVPRNPSGKIVRFVLRDEAAAEAGDRAASVR
jgi:acyl-CoA synthetase (AMP-forming)/AMP-acid ligase II